MQDPYVNLFLSMADPNSGSDKIGALINECIKKYGSINKTDNEIFSIYQNELKDFDEDKIWNEIRVDAKKSNKS